MNWRKRFVRELERTTAALSCVAVLLGGVLIAIGYKLSGRRTLLIEELGDSGSVSQDPLLAVFFNVVGVSLLSAGLVAIAFAWITNRVAVAQLTEAVRSSIEEVVTPLAHHAASGALRSYKWDCVIEDAVAGQGGYVNQFVHVSYTTSGLEGEVRAICIAADDDAVLAPHADDPRYLLRWLIDSTLDPGDRDNFSLTAVTVDSEVLKVAAPRVGRVNGNLRAEYRVKVPRSIDRAKPVEVSVTYRARKYMGDTRTRVG